MIASYSLSAIHLIIFIAANLTPILSKVETDCIATGVNNVLGNKGGVGINFSIGNTSILCICCHLASG